MAGVIGVTRENCACAVELLGHDEAGEGVGESEGSQREKKAGSGSGLIGPAVGRADGEDDVLRAFIAAGAEPGGESLRGELAAAAVEENWNGGVTALLTIKPLDECGFGLERFGGAFGKDGAAVQIDGSEGVEGVFGVGARTDVRQG